MVIKKNEHGQFEFTILTRAQIPHQITHPSSQESSDQCFTTRVIGGHGNLLLWLSRGGESSASYLNGFWSRCKLTSFWGYGDTARTAGPTIRYHIIIILLL